MRSGPATRRGIAWLRPLTSAGRIRNPDGEADDLLRAEFLGVTHAVAPKACPAASASVGFRSPAPSDGEGPERSGLHNVCANDKKFAAICAPCCKFEQSRCLHPLHREGIKSHGRCAESVAWAWTVAIPQLRFYRIDPVKLVEARGLCGALDRQRRPSDRMAGSRRADANATS
jgi:hypothetical protein